MSRWFFLIVFIGWAYSLVVMNAMSGHKAIAAQAKYEYVPDPRVNCEADLKNEAQRAGIALSIPAMCVKSYISYPTVKLVLVPTTIVVNINFVLTALSTKVWRLNHWYDWVQALCNPNLKQAFSTFMPERQAQRSHREASKAWRAAKPQLRRSVLASSRSHA